MLESEGEEVRITVTLTDTLTHTHQKTHFSFHCYFMTYLRSEAFENFATHVAMLVNIY
jgi:hypothetical protein